MIAKISRGWNAGGLLRYLMGPGRFNQHSNQRVVAAWDGAPELHQPAQNASVCGFDVAALSSELNAPAIAAGIPLDGPGRGVGRRRRGPIWHCSLRTAPGDPVLSDARWARVAADLLHRTGIAAQGDLGACRWVVVRHADDHVHVAAMLVRQDNGRRVHPVPRLLPGPGGVSGRGAPVWSDPHRRGGPGRLGRTAHARGAGEGRPP